MSKVNIMSIISGKTTGITKVNTVGTKDSDKLYFYDNGTDVTIIIFNNKIFMTRINDDIILDLEFEENKELTSKYVIKDINVTINLSTKTNLLFICDNMIKIEYDLFINGEYSDTFTYELNWEV